MSRQASRLKRNTSWWSRLSASQRGNVVIAIPVLCLITMFGAWVWTRQSGLGLNQQIDHTKAVITESDALLLALVDAETMIRGYDLTRDTAFLSPYNQSIAQFSESLARFNHLVEHDPARAEQVKSISQLAQQRLDLLNRRLAVLQASGKASSQPNTNPGQGQRLLYEGKAVMDTIRQQLANLHTQETKQLQVYYDRLRTLRSITEITLWTTTSLSLVGCVAAIYLFNQLDRELRQREQRLQENKTLIQAIVENMVDGVITLNDHNQIELFNPAAVRLFGYQPNEVMGQDLSLLLTDSLSQKLSAGTTVRFLGTHEIEMGRPWQTVGYRKDGTTCPIEISISDLPFDYQLIAIVRDITEQQQAKEKLESLAVELARINAILTKTNANLMERNQELDQFAYVASHDLKAPLRAIASLSEWIEEDLSGQLTDDSKRMMQLLRGRVQRMEALLNGLLEYSRVGRGRHQVEAVDVRQMLTEVIQSLDPPVTFIFDLNSNLPTFNTHRIALEQVFMQLIDNTIQHHDRADGHVYVSAQDLGNAYEFVIRDDGPGIAPQYHNKIFTIFQTLEARDTKECTGIGLSIVKKIVESQGGQINVDSEVGKGAIFRFTWLKEG